MFSRQFQGVNCRDNHKSVVKMAEKVTKELEALIDCQSGKELERMIGMPDRKNGLVCHVSAVPLPAIYGHKTALPAGRSQTWRSDLKNRAAV